ncbi:hypothetical protein B9N43_07470 [Denitratisoma sp. DHT3]|uniref:hypothetical protein n=1 Tax=Denitratisoma sp. DHT3 TaxID=1981880 RepID=UPI0011984556|nr:hypothetical protein [Denitratisoma sp. DHT3]QDX81093.1 hypothetical protein B9N43_07470 [Denitratisoma sp. DHT3]
MNRYPTLIEILNPQHFPDDPVRARATRTVIQAEEDKFELAERERSAAQDRERQLAGCVRRMTN